MVIGWDQTQRTLPELLRDEADQAKAVVRPMTTLSDIYDDGTTVRIVLPVPGARPASLVRLAIPLCILAVAGPLFVLFCRQTDMPAFIQIAGIGFGALVLAVFPLVGFANSLLRVRRACQILTASAEGIVIEERGAWRSTFTRISATDLLDIDYSTTEGVLDSFRSSIETSRQGGSGNGVPTPGSDVLTPWFFNKLGSLVKSRGIIIKSRKGMFSFGEGLSSEELRYLYWLVKRNLCEAPGRSWQELRL